MPSGAVELIKGLLFKNWLVKILAFLFALFLWFYVVVSDKVPFQVEVPVVGIPKGVKVFPESILVGGKISEKFYSESYLKCFKARLEWDGRSRYATVRVEFPFPSVFVEIDSVYPQMVEVKRTKP